MLENGMTREESIWGFIDVMGMKYFQECAEPCAVAYEKYYQVTQYGNYSYFESAFNKYKI